VQVETTRILRHFLRLLLLFAIELKILKFYSKFHLKVDQESQKA